MSTSTGNEANALASLGIKCLSKAADYREWRLAVIDILAEKGYWPIVSGTMTRPEGDSAKTVAWDEKAGKARGMLGRLMDSAHRELYAEERNPGELWTKLEKRYAGKDQARIWFLKGELSKVEFRNNDLVDYIATLERLFHQLAAAGETQVEKDKKYLLLSNLPIQYHPFRTSICNNQDYDSTTYDKICDRLVLEHQQLTGGVKPAEESKAFLAGKSGGWKGKGKDHANAGQKERASMPSGSVDKDSCLYCKEKGHWARRCPKKKKDQERNSGGGRRNDNRDNRPSANSASARGNLQAWTAMDVLSANRAQSKWVLDSGATHHMTSDKTLFESITLIRAPIRIANGGEMIAIGEGDIILDLDASGTVNQVRLKRALYVPDMGQSGLLSVRCIQAAGGIISFGVPKKDVVSIYHGRKLMGIACLENNAYVVQTPNREAQQAKIQSTHTTLLEWHKRLGHIGFDNVKRLVDQTAGMEIDGSRTNPVCVSCVAAKQTRKPNSSAATRTTTSPLQLIHSDVAGPMRTSSLGGARYFVLFIDDFSRFTAVFTLKQKSEVTDKFLEYKAWAENLHDGQIKALRSDNGGEYTSHRFTEILKENGITHEKTAPYSPEQNGVSERANRTLVGRAKAMMLDNSLDEKLWGEAIRTAVYLKNRTPTSANAQGKTPIELWTRNPVPTLSHLIPFGTRAFRHVPKERRTKWDSHGEECVVIGYEGTNQYRVLSGGKIHSSRDVRIVGDKGGKKEEKGEEQNGVELGEGGFDLAAESEEEMEGQESGQKERAGRRQESLQQEMEVRPESPAADWEALAEEIRDDERDTTPLEPRRSGRSTAGQFSSTRYYDEAFLAHLDPDEPASFTEAMSSPLQKEWKKAIEEELESIKANETWKIVDLPKARTPIKSRWVFRIKRGSGGEIIRYKARVVAKGFTQRYGIDYLETYAPVVKLSSLRILLALAAARNYEIDQTDIKTAYLLGTLDEEIYMEIPQAVVVKETVGGGRKHEKVCRLLKGLYGLKQSGRIWNNEWDRYLVGECGFKRSMEDYAVYYKGVKDDACWALIWVDDVLWIGGRKQVDEAKASLGRHFPVKDLGKAHYFLGIEIRRTPGTIALNQAIYTKKILERFQQDNSHPVSTPMNPGIRLVDTEEAQEDETTYRSLIGSLMYLMLCTRPDIAFAVGVLSKFSSNPKKSHMLAARHLLRYINKTATLSLHLGPFQDTTLRPVLYSDADWGGDQETRRSTGGYLGMVTDTGMSSKSAVSWSSKKQQTIALSSTEAEYMALTQAAKEAIWVARFMAELHGGSMEGTQKRTILYADNQGSMALAHNPEFHARTKHIAIQEHYIREKVASEEIQLEYLPTSDMIADCLTKSLSREKLERFRKEMGIY
jgi:transposase InsO family protein